MRRTLEIRHDRLPLARPFRIARGVKTASDVIVVTLGESGVEGRGEGVPYPRYGESIGHAMAEIEQVRAAIENGVDRAALGSLLPPGAARNAVDCALWDLEARREGKSVAAIIDAPEPGRIASALTVVIDTPEAMAAATRAIATAPLIKVKVDADDPAARIRAVRAAAPDAALIVDPNESWDEPLVRAMQAVLAETRVALLEQPVRAEEDAWLERFTPAVPIAADEAVHTAADLPRIVARYQVVNIKLDKTGGLTGALELARETRARGMGLMCGCMVSSSLSIAPALHIARLADYADLDGPVWLAEDRAGGVRDDNGWMLPPAPGFWGTP